MKHYSYSVYADPEMARRFDALRFGGPIGELVAEGQGRVLLDFANVGEGTSVLDVGTGTGRAALMLAATGARVTGVDASDEMLRVARERAGAQTLNVRFERGDAHALPFANGSFDVVVCLRVLMHTPGWRQCVGELCRVARTRIVIDYPALCSATILHAGGRRVAAAFGARTEAYRVLSDRAVRRAFAAHGFEVRRVSRQFVLPIALHKAIGSRRFTERVEAGLAAAGLLRVFGSPVTVLAERCASS
ncbi:MAG TPA: methyltransferase domain-containing protein [Vicinamibacterales bacterium]|nr:methyltransferase domain-containing protein [Vicinamibacterales bacterium]